MVCRGGEVRGQGGGGRAKSRVAAQMFAGLLVPDTAAGAPAAPAGTASFAPRRPRRCHYLLIQLFISLSSTHARTVRVAADNQKQPRASRMRPTIHFLFTGLALWS